MGEWKPGRVVQVQVRPPAHSLLLVVPENVPDSYDELRLLLGKHELQASSSESNWVL